MRQEGLSPRPEHVQRLDQSVERMELTIETMFSPEWAPLCHRAVSHSSMSREDVTTILADVGSIQLLRGLIDAGHFDDRPDDANERRDEIDQAAAAFQRILSALYDNREKRNG